MGELYLPKFSISTDYSLKNILPELGIKEIFSKQADLSGITGTKDLIVSQVRQETQDASPWVLNVDGEGHVAYRDGTCVRTPTFLSFLNNCPSSSPVH